MKLLLSTKNVKMDNKRILKISWANESIEFGTEVKREADFVTAPIAVEQAVQR
jgi:hypothetical protein